MARRVLVPVLVAFLVPCVSRAQTDVPPEDLVRGLREARIQSLLGQRDVVIEKLEQLAEKYPKDLLPLLALIALSGQDASPAEAAAATKKRVRERLANPEASLPFSYIRLVTEDPQATPDDLRSIATSLPARIEKRPEDAPRLIDALALLEERLGQLAAARETLGRLLKLAPTRAVLIRCIELDLELERWDDALALYRELATDTTEDDALIRWDMARLLARSGRREEAMKEADPLLREKGFVPLIVQDILMPLAWSLRDAGNDAAAEAVFRRVLEVDPSNREARNVVLNLYSAAEEKRTQAAALEERWRVEENADALLTEGSLRLASGDATSAADLLRRAAERLPESDVAWYNLGLASIKLERWSDAVTALHRSIERRSDRAEAHFNLGYALEKRGDYRDAVPEFERALALRPGMPGVHGHLAICYFKLGDTTRSRIQTKLAEGGK